MYTRTALYRNGAWVAPSSSERIEVENPTTEQVLGTIPAGSAEDVDEAVRAARAAFPAWSSTPVAERADVRQRMRHGLAKRQEEIAGSLATVMGCALRTSTKFQAAFPPTVAGR